MNDTKNEKLDGHKLDGYKLDGSGTGPVKEVEGSSLAASESSPSEGVNAAHARAKLARKVVTSHFWISAYPFFESSLFLVPGAKDTVDAPIPQVNITQASTLEGSSSGSGTSSPLSDTGCRIQVYDSDGNLANDATIEFPSDSIYALELQPLLGGCKLESGMKHAHLVVHRLEGVGVCCRVNTRESAAIVGEPSPISATQGGFFPITLASDRSNYLCFVNRGSSEATLRCRLFFGKRSPEAAWVIPGNASRIIQVETEFQQYTNHEDGEQVQAYLRLGTKSGELAVQMPERTEEPKEEGFFTSVS